MDLPESRVSARVTVLSPSVTVQPDRSMADPLAFIGRKASSGSPDRWASK
jgi:hypothetical protein